MPKIILTVGASSSGKTKSTEEFTRNRNDWVNINRDDLRFALFNNGQRDWTKYKFNKTNEKRVTEVQDQLAYDAVLNGNNVIISDTNLNEKIRTKWRDWAFAFGYEYEEHLYPCDWETLVKRNAQREGGLSESLLWDQYLRFEQQFGSIKPYKGNLNLPDTVICDIDGTIASMDGRRGPFDWSKVGMDSCRYEVLCMVEALGNKTHHVTFLSGRDGVCYQETLNWLKKHIDDSEYAWDLQMREAGDMRKDWVIKDELFEKYTRDKYNVVAVFDDRPQMIRHWTIKGLPNIISVGQYNKEF